MTLTTELMVEISSFQAPALTRTRPTRHQFVWSDLVTRLKAHRRSESKTDVAGWSPAVYGEGQTRSNAAVERISCAVGDFDHVSQDDYQRLRDVIEGWGVSYVLHSSYSSTPEELSFRVVIPFAEPVSRNDWAEVWSRVNHHLFLGLNDPQTKDLSRFFYVPSAPPDGLTFAASHEGVPLDVASLPPAPVGIQAQEHEPLDHRAIMEGIPEGQRDWTLYRLACDLRGKNVPMEYALLTIAEAARRCDPPFDVAEAQKKVVEAYRKFGPNPTLELTEAKAQAVGGDVPTFPVDALPEAFQAYVNRVARLKSCPPEYIAVPLLVAAGTTLGNVARIRLNATWLEAPSLFAALIGDPGSKKSPAIQQALRPVTRLQRALALQHKRDYELYQRNHDDWESQPKKDRGPEPLAPAYKHVMVNDVTIEKLAEVLGCAKGVVLAHDELASWVRGMDQYRGGKGADRQHYLSMWSGATIKVDRKNAPIPVTVESPCLGVVGGIQPEMLSELSDSRGRNDGFLDRLLWCYPQPVPDRWVEDDGEPDTIGDLDALFQKLYDCYGQTDLSGQHVPVEIHFSEAAAKVWSFWYEEHSRDRNDGNLAQNLGGPWAKMASQLARITLILHMIEGTTTSVAPETLSRAIRIVEYFKDHARKVFAELSESRGGLDIKILAALKKLGDMTQHEIRRKVFSGNLASEKIRSILGELEERGLVTQHKLETGGRPATVWSAT